MKKNKAFTLIETIIVISLTAILSVTFYYFLKTPMLAYSNIKDRGELTNEAKNIIYRIKQDIQGSLPNSVRITNNAGITYIEMISISGAGKYRSQLSSLGTGDILDFTANDTTFDVVSNPVSMALNNYIVIANLGFSGFDAYNSDNMSLFNGTPGTNLSNISISSKKFPLLSEYNKFYIINNVITYACDLNNKTLTKYTNYSIQTTQPNDITNSPLNTATKGLLSNNTTGCSFFYDSGVSTRNGFVGFNVELTSNQQKVSLYGETYVPNY